MKIPKSIEIPLTVSSLPIGKIGFFCGSILLGNWLASDVFNLPGGGLGLLITGAGVWWLMKPVTPEFKSPSTIQGWVNRCKEVLIQFKDFDDPAQSETLCQKRNESIKQILNASGPQKVAVISSDTTTCSNELKLKLEGYIKTKNSMIDLSWQAPLSLEDESWVWPDQFHSNDILIYYLTLPLKAADLLWLKKVPKDQPSWIFASCSNHVIWDEESKALKAQLPARWNDKLLRLDEDNEVVLSESNNLQTLLNKSNQNKQHTCLRLLERLHSSWQTELEMLRREKFRNIQKRNQWIVAGTVFASPVPTTDLLAVTVVNGLMITEMAQIWQCSIKPEVLQIVAKQLVGAALAQGVVEWSGQALFSVAKFHGSSWIAAGTLQALSAAYLTRVVGRSMADWMALNNGVTELNLESLKLDAPKLVKNAANAERVDWAGFLKQSAEWISQNASEGLSSRSISSQVGN